MDDDEKLSMQELHTKIVQCLEPSQLHDYLFQEGIIPENFIHRLRNSSSVPTEISRLFVFHLKQHCPFHVFLLALRQNNAYSFLANELEGKLENIKSRKRRCDSLLEIAWYDKAYWPIRRIQVYNKYREQIVSERHLLKRLCLNLNLSEFYAKQELLKQKWLHLSNLNDASDEKKQMAADLYFISLDAEIEYRRVKYDKALFDDTVLKYMKNIIHKTSNPKASLMLYLGRRASAMVMSSERFLEDGLKSVREATENGERIEPCRETGIVLLIYYNLLCQQYELTLDQILRENLIKIAKESLDHFAQERDDVSFDFRRIVMLKTSFIYLGIGLFCNILSVPVCQTRLDHARSCLEHALRDWDRMELRWKMIYHFANARIHEILKRWDLAFLSAKESYKFCKQGGFNREKQNILIFVDFIKRKC